MDSELKIKMYSFTIDCKDPNELAKFYAALLKWEIAFIDEEWACVYAPGTKQGAYPGILFQRNLEYNRLCGRMNRMHNSKWHIWILSLMIWKKRSSMQSIVVRKSQISNFPKIGKLCLILPASFLLMSDGIDFLERYRNIFCFRQNFYIA